jgi:membrane-bound serine protease (ClpP class)
MGMMQRRATCVATLAMMVIVAAALPIDAADVVRLRVEDSVQPASQRFIERGLTEADDRNAALVVLELDTPGGLLDTTRDLTTAITESDVPVAIWVAPGGARAASAGFFLLMSADIAVMAPGTNTGAASPVGGQGEEIGETLKAKVFNDAEAMMRSLAEQRGRNVEKAVATVSEALSYTADEALEYGLIDLVEGDYDTLLTALDGREVTRFDGTTTTLALDEATTVELERTFLEQLLSLLAQGYIVYFLLGIGGLGLTVEIYNPGAVIPGAVGAVCLVLGLYGLSILPVNWTGFALLGLAIILFILEVKVTSFGLLTIAGLVSFVLGSLMVFDGPVPAMRVSLSVAIPSAVVVAAVVIFLLTRVISAFRKQPVTGVEGMVGEEGRAVSSVAGTGTVAVHGEYWSAFTRGEPIETGASVRVVRVDGRRIEVEPAGDPPVDEQ